MSSYKTAFTARANIRERSAMFQIVLDKLYFMDQKSNLCAFARFYGYFPSKNEQLCEMRQNKKHDLWLNLKPMNDLLWLKALIKNAVLQKLIILESV